MSSINGRLERLETLAAASDRPVGGALDLSRLTADEVRELEAAAARAGDTRDYSGFATDELFRVRDLYIKSGARDR